MFQDVPSFIFSYQPIIHSSKKNFQQNPFLISLFQNFKNSADTFLFLFYFLIYILGKSIDQKSRSLVFKTFHLNLLHKTYPLFSPRSPFENQRNRYLFSLDFLATFTIRLCSQRGRNELINEYEFTRRWSFARKQDSRADSRFKNVYQIFSNFAIRVSNRTKVCLYNDG